MKGRDSSYFTVPGAVIFLSKWAVFVSGPWEGIFSCVGRQCAVTDSNTQRTSALVLTQTLTAGDEAGVCGASPAYTGEEEEIYLARWHMLSPHLSLSITYTNTHIHTAAAGALVLWPQTLDVTLSIKVLFTPQVQFRSTLQTTRVSTGEFIKKDVQGKVTVDGGLVDPLSAAGDGAAKTCQSYV